MKIQLSEDQKILFGAIGVFALIAVIILAFGAFFGWCDKRKIEKHESNINAATANVEQSEKKVEAAKEDAAEVKGEIKAQKEAREETNVEVNEKIQKRREAAANRERVRRSPVRNVNGTDLHRILNDADANRQP